MLIKDSAKDHDQALTPYRPGTMQALCKTDQSPPRILKSHVTSMDKSLAPEMLGRNTNTTLMQEEEEDFASSALEYSKLQ